MGNAAVQRQLRATENRQDSILCSKIIVRDTGFVLFTLSQKPRPSKQPECKLSAETNSSKVRTRQQAGSTPKLTLLFKEQEGSTLKHRGGTAVWQHSTPTSPVLRVLRLAAQHQTQQTRGSIRAHKTSQVDS